MSESNGKLNARKLSNSDLKKIGLKSFVYQTGFNFERMQAPSFAYCLYPGLKKIYGDNKDEICDALENNMDFINTEQHIAMFLVGLVLSMEESGENRELSKSIKTGLFGPMAGFGDAVVWFTLLPITAAISASLAKEGNVLGPILFLAFWTTFSLLLKVAMVKLGYNVGSKAIPQLTKYAKYLTNAAGIMGVMVIGAMIPNYVSLSFSEDLTLFNTVGVQSIFDSVLPSLLPAALVGYIYWLFKNKNVNILIIIFGIIGFSLLVSLLGWM